MAGLRACWPAAMCVVGAGAALAGQGAASVDVEEVLRRVGAYVGRYYERAATVICEETVRLQTLGSDLLTDGSPLRQLRYELRMGWEPSEDGGAPEASALRQLLTVNGRPPRARDKPGCMDPKSVSPDPLAMLLPSEQRRYQFTSAGRRRMEGRDVIQVDFRPVAPGTPKITWTEGCVSVSLPDRFRGRIWADDQTGEVLRIDEQLTSMFEFRTPREQLRPGVADWMRIERVDTSIRYRRVVFQDPAETVMLPESIETMTVFRNSGAPRVRKTQRFANYRRFVTDGRIVQP